MEALEHYSNSQQAVSGVSVSVNVLTDKIAFIHAVRVGVPGSVVKQAIQAMGNNRELFVRLLETTPGNLHRFYHRKALSRTDSEEVLDVLRVLYHAQTVFGDTARAHEWLNTPIPALAGETPLNLFDTFEGRQLVREALRKIEFGEFS
ncbi:MULTISPECIES: antitoxin Xre/MbcA/ParS toxin-binding domain-containing protein [Halomonadaceae]|uniref:antitoxin Xre/MbcA/ParS toxin-binding domain-containing protein n=1 Tax=Halomonadaceae TaxID=28256 RepID=UPI0012F0FE54|nr:MULTISPECIES: antitoxin Xre/MbcA/ParS toxin-binding domain-containing protein [Halomonas]CAD5263360.1 conserved hypothetical protein [Halomonas sp. 113]CAD5265358.1 conserved hypothetical protein [Halomonas sp. 59]CAD5278168.1 conserved hypothetical protein [Halomonas sp. I3]CAD5284825.1 conserved hypothetical protein [Halomonas sp. 156]VXB53916.1 conserved hypothetical protein [Halomonas titanicae]